MLLSKEYEEHLFVHPVYLINFWVGRVRKKNTVIKELLYLASISHLAYKCI